MILRAECTSVWVYGETWHYNYTMRLWACSTPVAELQQQQCIAHKNSISCGRLQFRARCQFYFKCKTERSQCTPAVTVIPKCCNSRKSLFWKQNVEVNGCRTENDGINLLKNADNGKNSQSRSMSYDAEESERRLLLMCSNSLSQRLQISSVLRWCWD